MAATIDQREGEVEAGTDRSEGSDPHADLAYINRHHCFPVDRPHPTAPVNPLSKLVARLRDGARRFLLGSYFEEEQQYLAHLVRTVNHLSEQVSRGQQAAGRAVADAVRTTADPLRGRIETIEVAAANIRSRVDVLDPVVRGIERIIAIERGAGRRVDAVGQTPADDSPPDPAPLFGNGIDYRYLLLENRYRGSEEEIRRRLEPYAELFNGNARSELPVLEIGAGRGELQQIFRSAGIPSYGIELDQAMVARCGEQGLDVRYAEGIAHLRSLPDRSLNGVIAVQVIEHLDVPTLNELFSLCAQKVRGGGRVAVETIHTPSLLALCHNYFRDPTHKQPLHPDTTQYMMELAGLAVKETRLLSPYPAGALLQEVAIDAQLDSPIRGALETINMNVRELNRLLFGHQDYCVVAEAEAR